MAISRNNHGVKEEAEIDQVKAHVEARGVSFELVPEFRDKSMVALSKDGVTIRMAFNPVPAMTTPLEDAVNEALVELMRPREGHENECVYYARYWGRV